MKPFRYIGSDPECQRNVPITLLPRIARGKCCDCAVPLIYDRPNYVDQGMPPLSCGACAVKAAARDGTKVILALVQDMPDIPNEG